MLEEMVSSSFLHSCFLKCCRGLSVTAALLFVFKPLNFSEDGLENLPVLEDPKTSAGVGTERSPAADDCLIFLIRVLSQEPIQSFMSDFLRHQR